MSDTDNAFGFGKFVPGFDFLQNLAKGATQNIPQMPKLANWVAPTINVEELDKRIEELKAVQFWLDQNATALKATIQALEVQKMTLATLKGMNFSMGDLANAFKLKAADAVAGGVQKIAERAADTTQAVSTAASHVSSAAQRARKPRAPARSAAAGKAGAAPAGVVDPMQWWGSLTQQFQQIAGNAMKDAAKQTAMDTTKNLATGLAKEAFKTASGLAGSAARAAGRTVATRAGQGAARKAPAKKTGARHR